jgi:hypothetical protein
MCSSKDNPANLYPASEPDAYQAWTDIYDFTRTANCSSADPVTYTDPYSSYLR